MNKKLVYAWLNKQIKAQKLMSTTIFGEAVRREYPCKKIQVYRGIKLLADIISAELTECDWNGNDNCDTNYIERSFMYRDYKFYSIGDPEEFEEEDKENEGK